MVKILVYNPIYRHRCWYVDFHHPVRFSGDPDRVHWLLIIEGYSRKIPEGMATEHQDTVTVLQLITSVIREYGPPKGVVSDNGSVFTSGVYQGLLTALEID
ncbi:MAG: hypothetical protein NVSMB52_03850 [Chloroflexota bacterium]